MNRKQFLRQGSLAFCATCVSLVTGNRASAATTEEARPQTPVDEALQRARYENTFTNNWMTDLFAAIDTELETSAKLKLMEACGRGCFNRHKFKQDIAAAGQGDINKLIAAYTKNFGVRREGDLLHISYSGGCYCPAARNRPTRPNDLHCECTRFTHETILQTALGRHIPVEVVESIRRGGTKCHLVAQLG